jgi:hypothetical protein
MEKQRIFNKPRRWAALGFAVLGLAGSSIGVSEAKPIQQGEMVKVAEYDIYNHEQTITIYKDKLAPTDNSYLSVANLKQSIAEAQEFVADEPLMNVKLTTASKTLNLTFNVVERLEVGHVFSILDNNNASWEPGLTERDYLGAAGMASYLSPALSSRFGKNINPDAINVGEQAWANMSDIELTPRSQAKLDQLFGGQARAEQIADIKYYIWNAVSQTGGVLVASRTAGLSYESAVGLLNGKQVPGKLTHQPSFKFQVSLPTPDRESYLDISSLKREFVA